MMKGRNELSVNQATLVEMAQEYFDARVVPCNWKVVSVSATKSCYGDHLEARIVVEEFVNEDES